MTLSLLLIGLSLPTAILAAAEIPVGPVPAEVREQFELSPFYQKHTSVAGFPIVGSRNVSDFALREAAWILQHMLEGRNDLLEAMAAGRVHLAVMAYNEYTTDVPEHANLKPRVYWDRRARGLGGKPVSCAEENLLCFPGDPYSTENILIHEFAHGIHGLALKKVDPSFEDRLRSAYRVAMDAGKWKGTYAASNPSEYWAEAVQSWFDDNRQNDALHNHVNTRAELRAYDPALAALCEEVLGDREWRYRKPMTRPPEARTHLAGWNPSAAPRFRWRDEPIPERPQVRIQTELGDIEVELFAREAPITVTNFLYYVHQGFYADGTFFRTVKPDNQPTNPVKIEVIQARADPSREADLLAPIPLERTRDTGLTHTAGTLSMARAEADSARDQFSILLEDEPELDYGGARNQDGQGFAAFGRVVKGMDVVRMVQQSPAEGQQLTPPIRIQRAIRLN